MSDSGDQGNGRPARSDDRDRRRALLRRAAGNIPGAQVFGRPAAQRVEPDPAPEAAPAAPPAPERPRKVRLSAAELRELRNEATMRAGALAQQDFYQRLGVPHDAPQEKVKGAWHALAKRFHPDRVAGHEVAEELQRLLHEVFAGLQEAWQALQDTPSRKAYDASLVERRREAEREAQRRLDDAALRYRKGEVLLRKRDFTGALEHMQEAHEADPRKAEWTVGYAWALRAAHPDGSQDARVRELLTPIARSTSYAGRANYYLGLLARMDDDLDAAERHFRVALEKGPELTAVHTELRALELRRAREGRRGLFRKKD